MKTRLTLIVLLFIVLGLSAPTASAAPRDVCVSTGNGNWHTAGTWSCGHVPTSADIVIVNNGHTVDLDLTTGYAYQLIVGGGTSGTLWMPLSLEVGAGGVSISNGGTFELEGELTIAGNLTVNGTFNGGSGLVFINQGDLNISSSGTFNAPGHQTPITNGNFTNSGTFNHNNGKILMNGSSAKNISSTGSGAFYDLRINNSAGVNLTSNATIQGTLTLDYDLRVSSGYALTMGASSATAGGADVIGKTKRTSLSSGTAYTFGSTYTTITFGSGGTLPSEVSVELFKTAPGGLANAVQRYYVITPTDGSGYTFDLRLHYLDSELSGITEANLQMWRQDSGRWTLQARTNNNTTDNWVEKTGLTNFSLWALSDSGAPTAVTLSLFDARVEATNALLFAGLVFVLGVVLWCVKIKDR